MAGRPRAIARFTVWLAAGVGAWGCQDGVDATKAEAYFNALQKQSDYVAERAAEICADPNILSQHSAIQGMLRDLNQYRIDFEGQTTCTQKNQCGPPERKAAPPPVFRAPADQPDPKGARMSKDTFEKLRALMADTPPKPFRDELSSCQSQAMSVAASAAVLVTTCTTNPGSPEHQRDAARLALSRQQLAAALTQARKAARP